MKRILILIVISLLLTSCSRSVEQILDFAKSHHMDLSTFSSPIIEPLPGPGPTREPSEEGPGVVTETPPTREPSEE